MASDGARKQFWKRSNSKVPGSIQHVYGAQHPPFDPLSHGTPGKAAPPAPATPLKAKRPSTFQEFESSTSDAWDAGEDEDELLAMAAESLNTEVVMETAHRVLRNHSQRQERPPPREAPQPRAEPALAPAPGGDLRLVKSVSESHTPCPAESASDTVPLQRSRSLPHSAAGALGGTSDPSTLGSSASSDREASRLDKFRQLITGPHTDLEELRKLSWSGIPKAVRPITWKLLSVSLLAGPARGHASSCEGGSPHPAPVRPVGRRPDT
uniref:TBC1 domain family member 22A n=1 Tax=Rousettus aegyptiacus TaxID=9407 RepID=A0A7J8JNM1_ROUAE|nr:TBC1 domain family member 22A [Rousettus aegyptiacus]